MEDLASAMTIFTKEVMDDLGVTDMRSIQEFAPNTSTFKQDLGDANVDGIQSDYGNPDYITRGGKTQQIGPGAPSIDFFITRLPIDRYNTESFTFTRGPNSILFGIGSPSGAFGASSKRARFKNSNNVAFQFDEEGTNRTAIDFNRVIKSGLLAVRYAGLYEEQEKFQGDENLNRRHYLTATLTPFKGTTIRGNYSRGHIYRDSVRPWPIFDGISAWLDAGSPIQETLLTTPIRPAGINRAYAAQTLLTTQFSPAGTQVPTLNWQNSSRSATISYPAYPNVNNKRSLINSSIWPVDKSIFPGLSYSEFDFHNYSIFVEQMLANNLFVEAAFNHERVERENVGGIDRLTDILYVDVNRLLPGGAPNPNVGMLYIDSNMIRKVPQNSETENFRLTSSYEFDFSERFGGWLKHLGRQRLAAAFEVNDFEQTFWTSVLRNVTPLPGYNANPYNAVNAIRARFYLDPSAGITNGHATRMQVNNMPTLFYGDAIPAAGADGITPAFINNAGIGLWQRIHGDVVVLESRLFKERLILVNGWRRDRQVSYAPGAANYQSLDYVDANGFARDPGVYNIRKEFPELRSAFAGRTSTLSAVLHALPWLDLTYNQSDNFQPTNIYSVYGEFVPNPVGDGRDYGVRVSLLKKRLFAELIYYENATLNSRDQIGNSIAGDFVGRINGIFRTVAAESGNDSYLEPPYIGVGTWSDVQTSSSSGWEAQLVANPTENWRILLNASKRSHAETSGRGLITGRWMDEFLPAVRSNPAWMSAVVSGTTDTVADYVADLDLFRQNLAALDSVPESNYAPNLTVNVITSYRFARGSLLKGFSIGANANIRGKTVVGYAEGAGGVLDPKRPYFARAYENVGAWVSYQKKMFNDKIDMRIQLNVRNVFDANRLFPLRIVDSRDGMSTGSVAHWLLNEPRTFTLTSEFSF